jgi:hypothetical protein
MSATGRGTIRDEKDFYATPRAAFDPLLAVLPRDAFFWEPCAGDGRLIRWLRESGRQAKGCDIERRCDLIEEQRDYLTDDFRHDFVITNPPFSLAFEMAQHALIYANEFMFLLRLSFLESEDRGTWFEKHEPNGLWVLKKRPSFVMSITCKSAVQVAGETASCKHNWLLPIESERPKICSKCGGKKLAISTSDSSGYAWYYWGPRAELSGIHHI